jgi:hypothetical protein
MTRLYMFYTLMTVLVGCSASTNTPPLTCEQRYNIAIDRGVNPVEALGDYTQCLINRGDTITQVVGR